MAPAIDPLPKRSFDPVVINGVACIDLEGTMSDLPDFRGKQPSEVQQVCEHCGRALPSTIRRQSGTCDAALECEPLPPSEEGKDAWLRDGE